MHETSLMRIEKILKPIPPLLKGCRSRIEPYACPWLERARREFAGRSNVCVSENEAAGPQGSLSFLNRKNGKGRGFSVILKPRRRPAR